MQDQHGRRYDKGEIAGASVDCIEDTAAGSFSYQYFSRLDRQRKAKSLILIPEMFALAMEEAGWIVRQQIVWAKKSCMPESVRDRFTRSWESIWMFSKSRTYFFDQEAVRVPGASDWANGKRGGSLMREHDPLNAWQESGSGFHRTGTRPPSANPDGANMRDVWWLSPEPSSLNHYASFVTEIPKRCILAGTSQRGQCPACGTPWARVVEKGPLVGRRARPGQPAHLTPQGYLRAGGSRCGVNDGGMTTTGWAPSCSCNAGEPVPQTVLDPFLGSGTTLLVASRLGRDGIGIELNPDYVRLAEDRIRRDVGPMFPDEVEAAAPAPPRSLDLFALIDAEEAV